MNYNLFRLNPTDFEHMIQSLMQSMLGINSIVYGAGADGARELTYEGKAKYQSNLQEWNGYWVIQAKYKNKEESTSDFKWVEKNFKFEMKKFSKKGYKKPDNYIFLTNAVLTPKLETGGRDMVEVLINEYKGVVPNIFIGGYDEICRLLDNNRDIATAYSSFILSGDILKEVLRFFERETSKANTNIEALKLYLTREFKNDQVSKLAHAGDLTHNVNLENVITDLIIKQDSHTDQDIYAIDYIINNGNRLNRLRDKHEGIVLIGGAGAGKSTITQFTTQLYIANFLKYVCNDNSEHLTTFIDECISSEISMPVCYRVPFKIILKDYAGWIDEHIKHKPTLLINYIQFKINIETGDNLEVNILRDFFKKLSFVFIFDGLDEVPANANRGKVLKEINDFIELELNYINCDAMIIATTRPQGYSSEFNKEKYKHFYVSDMNDKICLNYLDKLISNIEPSKEKKSGFMKILKESLTNEITSNLMRTPLQATIMAILVVTGGEPSSNKYGLFREYYETIFKREKQKRVSLLINRYENLINKIHEYLGFKLQLDSQNSLNAYSVLDKNEFEKFIINYLEEEEWEQEEIHNFIVDFRETITNRLVFITELQDEKIGFVIRSIQEFFAANYYMDAEDVIVKERIRSISTNAYWRNTLLFSIGFIRSRKPHLVEAIYVMCEEMNGIDEDPNIINFKDIITLGSWLTLDILSEGILNDSPKLINKFSRLLKNTITVNTPSEEYKFSRLQNRIKENWILDKFVTEVDASKLTKVQLSALINVLISLTRNGEKSVKDKVAIIINGLINEKTAAMILTKLSENSLLEKEHYPTLVQYLLSCPPLTFESILSPDIISNLNLYKSLFKIYKEDIAVVKSLTEHALLFIIHSIYSDEIKADKFKSLLDLISNKRTKFLFNTEDLWSLISVCCDVFTVESPFNFRSAFISIDKINKELLELLKDVSSNFKLDYITNYLNYSINPNKHTLESFVIAFEKLPYEIKRVFINANNDWLLSFILSYYEDNDTHHDLHIAYNIVGSNYVEWKDKEQILQQSSNSLNNYIFAESFSFTEYYDEHKVPKKIEGKTFDHINELLNTLLLEDHKIRTFHLNTLWKILRFTKFSSGQATMSHEIFTNMTKFLYGYDSISTRNSIALLSCWNYLFCYTTAEEMYNSINNSDYFKLLNISDINNRVVDTNDLSSKNIVIVFNALINFKSTNSFVRYVYVVALNVRYKNNRVISD